MQRIRPSRRSRSPAAVGTGGVLVSALGPRAALLLAGLGPILAVVAGLTALHQRGVAASRQATADRPAILVQR